MAPELPTTDIRISADLIRRRKGGTPIVCLTAYTAPVARLLDPHVDILLVGDSLGMVVYGLDSTLPVTLDMMIAHGAAVVRASERACVVVDLPFGSYQESREAAFRASARVMAETGAQAVKLEGGLEMAETVAGVYNNLPPEVRAHTAIFGQNYGQAGAINLFGPRYGLPRAISGHQSYFLWGPQGATGESMIVMADRQENLERVFTSVRKVAHLSHPYSMPYEQFDIFYCTGIKQPLAELWPKVKNWD